jgi:hypothetical protein
MITIGKYTAGKMIAKASGNAAMSPMLPSTSQVSLPSHIGATEFIISRRHSGDTSPDRMPTPRSKPSNTT